MATRFSEHLITGTHAARPAASAVPDGTLYSCTTHSLVYQSDTSAWSTWATLGSGGGGGGITRTTLGTTSVGASFENPSSPKIYMKKITLATDGVLASISLHLKGNAGAGYLAAAVRTDNAGTPDLQIAASAPPMPYNVAAAGQYNIGTYLSTTARWFAMPIGQWLAAGDYWLAVMVGSYSGAGTFQIAYASGTGSDRTVNSPSAGTYKEADTITTTTNDFSIYADILR